MNIKYLPKRKAKIKAKQSKTSYSKTRWWNQSQECIWQSSKVMKTYNVCLHQMTEFCMCAEVCVYMGEIEQGSWCFVWEELKPFPSCAITWCLFAHSSPQENMLGLNIIVFHVSGIVDRSSSLCSDFFWKCLLLFTLLFFYFLTFLFALNHLRV